MKPREYSSTRLARSGEHLRQMLVDLFGRVAQRAVGLAGIQPRQIGRHRADRRRNRHVVVVENDDQPRIHRAGIVHGLIGHAGGHRAVADHGDDIILAAGRGRAPPPCRGAAEIEVEEWAAPNGS